MADPISSSRPVESNSSSYDPYSDEVGKVSRADAPNSSQPSPPLLSSSAESSAPTSPAVPKLVSSVPRPPSALPPTASAPPASTANNNAERTAEGRGITPRASVGVTAARDSMYVAGAILKGRDASGAEVEVVSASVQVGAQNEAQFGFQRVGGAKGALSGTVETFALRANAGIHNDDGSTGLNLGASATGIGFEGTLGRSNSVTYGVGAGFGVGASIGVRDGDGNGKKELCVRISAGPALGGICLESPL